MNKLTSAKKKAQDLVKLKRLAPGANTALSALLNEEGTVITDPASMATLLIQRWQEVFTHREVELNLLDSWYHQLPQGNHLNSIRKENNGRKDNPPIGTAVGENDEQRQPQKTKKNQETTA